MMVAWMKVNGSGGARRYQTWDMLWAFTEKLDVVDELNKKSFCFVLFCYVLKTDEIDP